MNKQIKNIIFDWGGVLIDLNLEGCISASNRREQSMYAIC